MISNSKRPNLSQVELFMNKSAGMTDDLSVNIKNGKSNKELTQVIMDFLLQGKDDDLMIKESMNLFGLSDDDANLAIDQVSSGIVGALTGYLEKKPNKNKDPIGWLSFMCVWGTLPKRGETTEKYYSQNEWFNWYEEMLSKETRRIEICSEEINVINKLRLYL